MFQDQYNYHFGIHRGKDTAVPERYSLSTFTVGAFKDSEGIVAMI